MRVCAFALLTLASPAWAVRYRCVDLGALYSGEARAMALNDTGMVVGSTGTGDRSTMVWSQQTGMFTPGPLMTLFENGLCLSVNKSGSVVGWTHWGRGNDFTPFLWRPGKGYTLLDRRGQRYGTAYSVNSFDESCGDINLVPVTWDSSGRSTLLPKFEGRNWYPNGINDDGVVCGSGSLGPPLFPGRALRHAPGGQPENLGVLLGFDQSRAFAVNNSGTIVGYCDNVFIGAQGFIARQGETMQALGPIDTECLALNESEQVVGNWYNAVGINAMLIEPDGKMYDLNTVTENIPQGWRLASSTGINERGDISGYAVVGSKVTGFLLQRLDNG